MSRFSVWMVRFDTIHCELDHFISFTFNLVMLLQNCWYGDVLETLHVVWPKAKQTTVGRIINGSTLLYSRLRCFIVGGIFSVCSSLPQLIFSLPSDFTAHFIASHTFIPFNMNCSEWVCSLFRSIMSQQLEQKKKRTVYLPDEPVCQWQHTF